MISSWQKIYLPKTRGLEWTLSPHDASLIHTHTWHQHTYTVGLTAVFPLFPLPNPMRITSRDTALFKPTWHPGFDSVQTPTPLTLKLSSKIYGVYTFSLMCAHQNCILADSISGSDGRCFGGVKIMKLELTATKCFNLVCRIDAQVHVPSIHARLCLSRVQTGSVILYLRGQADFHFAKGTSIEKP